jgi:hypothetical protein
MINRHSMRLVVAMSFALAIPAEAQLPDWVSDILVAARLPVVADSARREGTANESIRDVLEAMTKSRLPAHEATVILDSARMAHREHGPVDNFGAFVQSQLAQGKRGRELAAAIRAEHARSGKGNAGRGGRGAGRQHDDTAAAGNQRGQGRDTARGRGRDTSRSSGPDSSLDKQGNSGQGRGRPARPDR